MRRPTTLLVGLIGLPVCAGLIAHCGRSAAPVPAHTALRSRSCIRAAESDDDALGEGDDPREAEPLMSTIYPLVQKRADEISDPDAREMAEKAVETVAKLAGVAPKAEANIKEVLVKHGGDVSKIILGGFS